jgi:iron(III) transport system ATP-binding protein
MTELAVTGLAKAFGQHQVLDGLDLDVPAGSLTAILGPSGSGKTTLLRILAGFERADAGTVRIGPVTADGPGTYRPPERRRIGYVPQEGSLFPHLTVAANVAFGLSRRERHAPARAGQRAAELLDAVGLAGLAKRYPHQLSGGQQQRVALARALAIRPEVVLLDEPFASLDAHLRASVRADVQRLLTEAGATTVLVTHDQDEALSTADRVAVLRDGRIAQCAAPQQLYSSPVDADMARFIGEANLIPGQLNGSSVQTLFGKLPVTHADPAVATHCPATVLIRPEQVELLPGADELDGAVAARVTGYGYHGHDAVVTVLPEAGQAGQDPALRPLIVRTLGGDALPLGAPVMLRARGPVLAWPDPAPAS